MVGAYSGIDAIPKDWQQGVENLDVLVGTAENLAALACREDAVEQVIPRQTVHPTAEPANL
jgi:hypothetical protein